MGCASSSAGASAAGELRVVSAPSNGATKPISQAAKDFHRDFLLGPKLGQGHFGQVRSVTNVATQAPESAVKILDLRKQASTSNARVLELRGENADGFDYKVYEAAVQEAKMWQQIGNHPNIVSLHDQFFNSSFCFLVMEKCQGGLYTSLEAMPEVTERTIGLLLVQMLESIAHVHSRGVIHRDIKPANFLIAEGNSAGSPLVKLADFGFATTLEKSSKLKGIYGTAPYMAPEMLAGTGYDEKSDVWSMAVIVYVVLFGIFPYMPPSPSKSAMKQAIQVGGPVSFEPVVRGDEKSQYRSADALSFAKALLDRNPKQRPGAAEAMSLPWMKAVQAPHSGEKLPSLKPMISAAKVIGAFELKAMNDTRSDTALNAFQMQYHEKELPPTNSSDDKKAAGPKCIIAGPPCTLVKATHAYDDQHEEDESTDCDTSTGAMSVADSSDISLSPSSSSPSGYAPVVPQTRSGI